MRSRRGKGEGSIYFRESDKMWCASVTVGYDGTGKRKRRVVYGRTKQLVREELTRLHASSVAGMLGDPQRLTVCDYLKRWLEDSSRPTIRESTYIRYESVLRIHVYPHLGGIQLSKLQPSHIQGLYSRLEKDSASPRTRELAHAVLHKALKQALLWGYVPRNVTEAVRKPRVPKKPMLFYDREQVGLFLEEAKGDRFYALYVLAISTGLREGELLGLQWQDVDLKRGFVSIQRQLLELKGVLSVGEPKSARGKRQIDLPKFAIEAVKEHRKRMLGEGHHQHWVFCDTVGGPLRRSNFLQRSYDPIIKRAKLPRIRFHDLRHTAATLLFSQGVHPKVVQERLGHATIGLTLDTYSHVIPTMQKDAADKLDDLMKESKL